MLNTIKQIRLHALLEQYTHVVFKTLFNQQFKTYLLACFKFDFKFDCKLTTFLYSSLFLSLLISIASTLQLLKSSIRCIYVAALNS